MARETGAKIVEWGTPPEPEPTGWDAIRIELGKRPGEWAKIGTFSAATARKIGNDRFPASEGFETRAVAGADGKSAVWIRYALPERDPNSAATDAAAVAKTLAGETWEPSDASAKPRTTKRGSVV